MKKITVLLEKINADIWATDNALMERYTELYSRKERVGNIVKDILVKIKNKPEYAKHLKYTNDKHAQDHQAKAQDKQADAQKQLARAGWANAAVNGVAATAQAFVAVAKLAKSAIDPFNPFKK